MINELISKTFADRNAAHLEHWATRSYAAHQALGAFYDGLIDAVDVLVEAYQGHMGPVGSVSSESVEFSIENLQDTADWIEVNRKEIAGDSDAVANLVDAVTAIYLTTIYKLKTFK